MFTETLDRDNWNWLSATICIAPQSNSTIRSQHTVTPAHYSSRVAMFATGGEMGNKR